MMMMIVYKKSSEFHQIFMNDDLLQNGVMSLFLLGDSRQYYAWEAGRCIYNCRCVRIMLMRYASNEKGTCFQSENLDISFISMRRLLEILFLQMQKFQIVIFLGRNNHKIYFLWEPCLCHVKVQKLLFQCLVYFL